MTSPIETNNVVERLKKRKRVLYDDDTLRYAFELINPDGPDAVKVIQSLSDRIDVLEALIRDELFDASTSPPRSKGPRYFEAWQTGYDAALNRVLERASLTQDALTFDSSEMRLSGCGCLSCQGWKREPTNRKFWTLRARTQNTQRGGA